MGSPCRVLIVEDHDDCAKSLELFLHLHGYSVKTVANATSALSLPSNPHVVLLDLGLPDLDGYEAARLMRAKAPRLYIIALTGYAGPATKQHCRDAGIDLHLVKPADLDLLLRVLQSLCFEEGHSATPIRAHAP